MQKQNISLIAENNLDICGDKFGNTLQGRVYII